MSNNEFGIKLKYDGKEVDTGVTVSREQLAKIGIDAEEAGKKAAASLDHVGMSAKATSAALRGIPAQFTDIVTSLQGGQAPLTVLLQQGGQLKDMFGGTGNAAKALGGYVLGLVNPFTVAAAAGAALGVAYYQGAAEATAFNKTLILSGNVAATSSGQMQDLARKVAASTGATRGAVSETLNEIMASGKVSADILGKVTQAAIGMERAGGAAASDTAKEFAELGKSPVEAVLKLNDKYHFLTASVYEQVKALQDQGRDTDAARVAQTAYADIIEGRVPALTNNLGILEKAWRGVKDAAKGTWDAMLDIGREDTPEAKLAALADKIAAAKSAPAQKSSRYASTFDAGRENVIARMEAEATTIRGQIDLQNRLNFKQAESNLLRETGLAKAVEASKLRERYLTKEQQLNKEIAVITASSLTAEEKKNALLMVREKFKEKEKGVSAAQLALIARSDQETLNRKALEADLLVVEKARLAVTKLQQQAEEAAFKEIEQRANAMAKSAEATSKETEKIREHTQELGLNQSEIDLLRASREDDLIALQEHELAEIDATGQCTAYSLALRNNIDALKARKSALQDQAAKQTAVDEAKASEKAWKDFYTDLERGLTDSLYRSFEAGKGFGETFIGSLKNLFKSTVLKIGVQGVMSMVGMGSAGSSLAGDASGSSNGSSLLSMGNSAYNAWSGGTGGLYNSFATSGIGAGLGLSTGLASSLGVAGGAGSVMGGSAALAAAEASSAGAMGLTGLGSTVGAALPWVGAALAVASMFMKSRGGPKTEGDYFGNIDGDGDIVKSTGATGGEGRAGSTYWFTGNSADSQLETLAPTIGKSIFETVKLLGGDATGIGINYGYNTDPKGTAPDNIAAAVSDKSGKYVYEAGYDVERGKSSEALQLEFQKMTLAAIEAADGIQPLFKDIVAGIDLTTATADQMAKALSDVQSAVALRAAFDKINLGADNLSVALIKGAGGIAALATNLDSYYQTYFNQEERTAKLADEVSQSFVTMNVAMPSSLSGFRRLVESLDLTTASGQSTFASLMSVQGAFAQVTQAADAAAATVAARLSASQETQASRIEKYLDAQRSAQLDSLNAQKSAYSDQVSAAQTVADAFDGIVKSLAQYRQSLLVGDSSPLSPGDKYAEATRNFDATATRARLGDKDAASQLQTVTDAWLASSKAANTDPAAYAVDFGKAMGTLDTVIGTADRNKSIAQQQLEVAQAQLSTLESMASALSAGTVVTTLPTVVADFAQASKDWQGWFDQTKIGETVNYDIGSTTRLSQDKGMFTDNAGSSYVFSLSDGAYALADQSAAWAAEMKKRYGTWKAPGFASGGSFAGGLRLVGENGPELEVTGPSHIYNAGQTLDMLSGGGILEELRALRAELAALRADQRDGHAAIASNTSKTARALDRVMPDGDALQTRAAA